MIDDPFDALFRAGRMSRFDPSRDSASVPQEEWQGHGTVQPQGWIEDGIVNAAKIVAGSVTADKLSVGTRTKNLLVANPGFEDGSGTSGAGWSLFGNATIAAGGHTGAQQATLAAVGAFDASCTSNRFPVAAGETVYLSVWAKAVVGTANLTAQLNYYDASGVFITNTTIVSYSSASTSWAKSTGSLVAPANTAFATLQLYSGNAATTIAADDVELRTGDSLITSNGNVLIDSTGVTILNGALILQDEFAKTVMVSSGFSGNWSDYVAMGLYNARFLSGAAGAIANGRTSALPYWTLANTAGSPVATFVANGGVAVTFAALSNMKSFTSDTVNCRPNVPYHVTFSAAAVKGAAAMFLILQGYVDWFQADGTASAVTATSTLTSVSYSASLANSNVNMLDPVIAPSDAAFGRVRFTIEESALGAHDANHKLTMKSVGFKEVPAYQRSGGTFPTAPAQYDRFFRTDLGLEFYWDGTRWLSTTVYQVMLHPRDDIASNGDLSAAIAATTAAMRAGFPPLHGGSDHWLTDIDVSFFVTGGTALGAANKWVGTMAGITAGGVATTQATVNVDSGASGTWRNSTTAIGALRSTSAVIFQFTWTKTGTPGTMISSATLSYRVVG